MFFSIVNFTIEGVHENEAFIEGWSFKLLFLNFWKHLRESSSFKKVKDVFNNKKEFNKKNIIVDTIEDVKETLKDITKKSDVSIKTAVPGKNTIGAIADAAGRALKSADFVAFKELLLFFLWLLL